MAHSKCVPDYEAGVLKELQCPRCLEYMLPPIKLCESGHNICSACRLELIVCPTCNKGILNVNNISLENLARETNFPCKYLKSGCDELVRFSGIKQHQAECSFGNYNCPFARISKEKCNWCGRLSDMIKHIKEAHMEDTETLNADGWIKFRISIPCQGFWFQEFTFTPNVTPLSFSTPTKNSGKKNKGQHGMNSESEQKTRGFGSSGQPTPVSGIQTQELGSKRISAATSETIFGSGPIFGSAATSSPKFGSTATSSSFTFGLVSRSSTPVASVSTAAVSSGLPVTSNSMPASSNSTTVSSSGLPVTSNSMPASSISTTVSSSTTTVDSNNTPVFSTSTPVPSTCLPVTSRFASVTLNFARQAILALEELFYVVFKAEEGKFSAVVIHVGPREDSSKFKYRLTLSSKHENVTFTLIVASFMDDIEKIFQLKNCVEIVAVSRFAKNNKLEPKIEILKCEDNAQQEERERENDEDGIREVGEKVKDISLS